jgi:predicted metal-dependent phosphoesterase TrpH
MSFVDLHLHTRYSDGSWTPDDLCHAAAQLKLAAIAVTDHDTLDGVPEMLVAGQKHGIEVLAGVEVTCRIDTREIHLLGYLPDDAWQNRELQVVLDHSKRVREKRIGEMVARINELGIDLTTADVFAGSDCGTIGRPHVATALVKRGVVKNNDEAFERFLKRGKPGFVDRYRMSAAEAIALIKRAGGVSVLAHPALNRVDEEIPNLVQQGLDGLEIWHSRHSDSQVAHYRKIAERFELLMSGGSDCHGTVRGKAILGSVPVPYECLTAIRNRAMKSK